jgi:hypothetical protein
MQELRFSYLKVSWACRKSALGPLHDMIARRNPPGDVRNPSPKEVIIPAPGEDQKCGGDFGIFVQGQGDPIVDSILGRQVIIFGSPD